MAEEKHVEQEETKGNESQAQEEIRDDINNDQEQEEVKEEASESKEKEEEKSELSEEEKLELALAEQKEKYLRLYSEFENYRRRTAKEKLDLIKTAAEDTIVNLLPVLDDFERAQESMEKSEDVESVKEGIKLIYDKFYKILDQQGLKPINAQGKEFDAELHEGVTNIPAPSEDMKGKVVDEIEKGYYLNEKVIRYSKVVIGS